MKHVISIFILSAFTVMSFRITDRIEFSEFFQMAFDQSFVGLEKMKDPKTGNWEFEKSVGDFDACEIRYDMERGVHAIHFIENFENESTALQFMARYSGQVEYLLPQDMYQMNGNASTRNKIVYEHKSRDIAEKAKYPIVEIIVDGDKESARMVVKLFEPLNKKSVPARK